MVSKKSLLGISALVWMIAGFNVLRLGILEYPEHLSVILVFLTVLSFLPFGFMFQNMVKKNTIRINSFTNEKILFLKFFPLKSYLIITFMMSFGIFLRNNDNVPRYFIAFFYTGLGTALFLAGIKFAVNFFRWSSQD
ncbi:hypothetical protein [Acetobacterium woodii]|uniref:Uncharacterized protein n=1 Tax=Acetobacterium woodii (strain ATCC 29683 / DSM 1030 / JCM 2381 / KCTC 1655 / WB1) TaxID=931626 RepID=H6LHT5_ACEWD|nr:hypothetical protein [Acetobacterium woodii]AFA47264.1 hypothetical protein membrane protein [Acetobacterium woodii DSM 1030]